MLLCQEHPLRCLDFVNRFNNKIESDQKHWKSNTQAYISRTNPTIIKEMLEYEHICITCMILCLMVSHHEGTVELEACSHRMHLQMLIAMLAGDDKSRHTQTLGVLRKTFDQCDRIVPYILTIKGITQNNLSASAMKEAFADGISALENSPVHHVQGITRHANSRSIGLSFCMTMLFGCFKRVLELGTTKERVRKFLTFFAEDLVNMNNINGSTTVLQGGGNLAFELDQSHADKVFASLDSAAKRKSYVVDNFIKDGGDRRKLAALGALFDELERIKQMLNFIVVKNMSADQTRLETQHYANVRNRHGAQQGPQSGNGRGGYSPYPANTSLPRVFAGNQSGRDYRNSPVYGGY